jgi:hypothetical protein
LITAIDSLASQDRIAGANLDYEKIGLLKILDLQLTGLHVL